MENSYDLSLISSAFGLVLQLALPLLAITLLGALILGIIQTATQIQDDSIKFTGKFIAGFCALMLFGLSTLRTLTAYAVRLWGDVQWYQ
ncbi:flagellar biosynthetic protein FliQ [bacterium]|nr:flagellar biosynthetic protein FliQ [bacterium]